MCNFQSFEKEYPTLIGLLPQMRAAFDLLRGAFAAGGKLLLGGNGGSAADCEHIAGELLKSFLLPRPFPEKMKKRLAEEGGEKMATSLQQGLPAVSLPSLVGVSTAFCNDVDPSLVYAQLTLALGRERDVLLCISTSGNAENVVAAAKAARAAGIRTVALTGKDGGKLAPLCDTVICVPRQDTYAIQEAHLPIYHVLCAELENYFFGGTTK